MISAHIVALPWIQQIAALVGIVIIARRQSSTH